jgi:prepilin-type N-terminal cleavage/methylation domain-containing protein
MSHAALQPPRTRGRQAFTLVEMLVVITIIAILAGLLFPVFNVLREKAWATRTRNIAEQAARGWGAHRLDFRAYPVTLIKKLPEAVADADGDYKFPMSRAACNLLNWFGGKDKDFAGTGGANTTDPALEAEWYELVLKSPGVNNGDGIARPGKVTVTIPAAQRVAETTKDKTVNLFLREKYFERNETQWRNDKLGRDGLWGERDNRRVWVKLDTNYDGIVKYLGTDAAGNPTEELVRQVSIAWGEDPSGKNYTVKSW